MLSISSGWRENRNYKLKQNKNKNKTRVVLRGENKKKQITFDPLTVPFLWISQLPVSFIMSFQW